MKAVILEIRGKSAAAMDESGSILRIPNAAYTPGQEIELRSLPRQRRSVPVRRFVSVAAAAALVLGLGVGTAYAMPYDTVRLDVNPSVEYTINCFDYVLDVKALNEDAEAVLDELDTRSLRHQKIDRAIVATVEQIEEDGYLEEEDSAVRISAGTRSGHHSEALQQKLEATVRDELQLPVQSPRKPAPGSENGLSENRRSSDDGQHGEPPADFGEPPHAGRETNGSETGDVNTERDVLPHAFDFPTLEDRDPREEQPSASSGGVLSLPDQGHAPDGIPESTESADGSADPADGDPPRSDAPDRREPSDGRGAAAEMSFERSASPGGANDFVIASGGYDEPGAFSGGPMGSQAGPER